MSLSVFGFLNILNPVAFSVPEEFGLVKDILNLTLTQARL